MANIDFQRNKDPNRHNIAFLTYGEIFNFVVTNLNDPILSYDNRTDFVDKIIINPCSNSHSIAEIKKGSVKHQLSPSALINNVKLYYSEKDTPFLFKATEGDLSGITRNMIFEAINNGDDILRELYIKTIGLTAVLVNNLVFSTNPQKIVMHNFNFTDSEFTYFKSVLEEIAGEEISKMIDLSIIEEKNRFLAGSAIAIREFFFSRGGFDLKSTE